MTFRRGAPIIVAVLALAATATTAGAQQGQQAATGAVPAVQCQICHADRGFLEDKTATAAGDSALFVTDSMVDPSIHGDFACADCHPNKGVGFPHPEGPKAVPCSECHADAGQAWDGSIHATNVAEEGDAASCADCHGAHEVFPADDRRSKVHPLNVAETCATCHADPAIIGEYFATRDETQARRAVSQYFETVHGTAITESGLTVSATCNDCHRGHEILPADSTGSSVHPSNIPETCGQCHEGIIEVYDASAHGGALRVEAGEADAPVCTECHTSHEIVEADQPGWFLGVVEECGACHEELYEEYLQTYHGKVTALGSGLAAQCSECHTAHRMLPASDPESSVHPDNLVETCAQCHPDATENFVQYYAHGDHTDREEYPKLFWPYVLMTTLLIGVFAFFGTHTALWLTRASINALRGTREDDDAGREIGHDDAGRETGHDEEDRS